MTFETLQLLATRAMGYLKLQDGRVVRVEDCPEWVTELCRKAHEGPTGLIFPSDFRYEQIWNALDAIQNADCIDSAREAVESGVSCYSDELASWLSAALYRQCYVDEAIEEFSPKSCSELLGIAQALEISEVFHAVIVELERLIEDGEC